MSNDVLKNSNLREKFKNKFDGKSGDGMTKVDAIEKVMNDYGGIATLNIIYSDIEKYYPGAKASAEWQAGIRGVLYRDINKRFIKLDTATYATVGYDVKNLLPEKNVCDVSATEMEVLSRVRIYQNKYRKSLLKVLKQCPITGITDKRLLVASHIKPWCLSSNEERLDIFNGFILSPLYDKLFDQGLITFTPEKRILYSSTLSAKTLSIIKVKDDYCENLPVANREKYLAFHHEKIFIE